MIKLDCTVQLVTTPCNFGGARYWFVCPLVVNDGPCRKRVGKLYLPPGSKYFGCRHCHDLTYRCQKEHDKRIDALLKNPAMLLARLTDGDSRAALVALKTLSILS